ncbi:hypothetical protein NDU88_004274 [Pleurodeles waltl]|uniref:Uncharacterized protein n=1 Tax=Pleurodeles waltl TaxID=8319 RepID=A0AAV7WU48_PLEWA|nr:hypothetical protein NDU88_004274 [Pleurodeles waltl]
MRTEAASVLRISRGSLTRASVSVSWETLAEAASVSLACLLLRRCTAEAASVFLATKKKEIRTPVTAAVAATMQLAEDGTLQLLT